MFAIYELEKGFNLTKKTCIKYPYKMFAFETNIFILKHLLRLNFLFDFHISSLKNFLHMFSNLGCLVI